MPAHKRDVVFLVADSGIKEMVLGFLTREGHRRLGCGPFTVEAAVDFPVATRGRDPEVYSLAHELLRPYVTTHRHAVVMLDARFEGSPGAKKIHDKITRNLKPDWDEYAVVVFEPELEAWVWQDNPNVAAAFGCPADFRQILETSGHWPANRAKPINPKAALTYLRQKHRADKSNAAFRRLAERVSVRNCIDPAFLQLRDTLRDWFPEENL